MRAMSGADVRSSSERRRTEVGLVALGVVLHSVYMLSIFDIYFKSPIVHGMDPVSPRFSSRPPASRLVLLVADGLRADKFFEPDKEGQHRAPFLRSIIQSKGRWGVSHARPPTESRPGHVAIIAGFYEDPSAVTKGWKANPVEFDSVFNRSRHTFAFGSPDIVPIFCSALPHCTWNSYPHDYEDFASDASFLDLWSLDQLRNILNKSNEDLKLKELLLQDKLIIFLHLLGCDTNGHAHRPYSPIYLNNVKVVDGIAKDVYALMEEYFQDNRTAYVFTADHGMSDKGSHGDGHPSNTDTPLVAWGAGIQGPKWLSESNHVDDGFRFVDEHSHDMPTPTNWGLERLERLDVNQADIAPLMATIIGLPCPVNSVGSLPLHYVSLNKVDEVEASLANTKQILNQFLHKSKLKQSNSLHFKPFKPLDDSPSVLFQIEKLIASGKFDEAMKLSLDLRNLSLAGLHYFQTYDWLMLMTTITLGYIGWMICLALHVVKSYTTLVNNLYLSKNNMANCRKTSQKVYLCGFFFALVLSVALYLQHSPLMYYAYCATTVLLWTLIFGDFYMLRAIWRQVSKSRFDVFPKFLALFTLAVFISEFLVISFSNRHVYTWFFLIAGLVAAVFVYRDIPGQLSMPIFLCAACWFLSIFTMFPAEIPHNTPLVVVSGFIIILTGITARHFNLNIQGNKHWLCIVNYELKSSTSRKLFHLQVLLVVISSIMVWLSTSHRTEKQELLFVHQIINWLLAGFSIILPLFSQSGILTRLLSIFLGFAPSFLILSIGYEALFYTALCLGLMAWILFECVIIYSVRTKQSISGDIYNRTILGTQERYLQLADIRVPLIFMVFFNVAFFGTGNFASIASFEISSVYRFITIFSPFLMAALLIFKLLIPFFLVICAFSAITKLIQVPRVGCYFLVILFSDVMTVHFFFLVRNTGSWMEIGNSISHFGIMNAQIVFVLLLFAFTKVYTRDIQVGSSQSLFSKVI